MARVLPILKLRTLSLIALACLLCGASAEDVARGDEAWARRAEGALDARAQPKPIEDAIESYDRALAADPESLEARWKLLRALHFAADFVVAERARPLERLERGTAVAEEALDPLARRLGLDVRVDEIEPAELPARLARAPVLETDVARLYFWAAIHWGGWSRQVGLLAAVREGVANRMRRYTRTTLALEPGYEEGGAYRLLGRLHAGLPRVPFLSGWVDRNRAIPLLEEGFALAPGNPGNQLVLAGTLLELAPSRGTEAERLLREVAGLTPRATMVVEDLAMQKTAREQLDALEREP